MFLKGAALFLALVTTGCAVGPYYRRPAVETPPAWKAAVDSGLWKPAEPSDAAPKGEWWRVFKDKELDALEERALKANQSVKRALARVNEARSIARLSASEFFPDARAGLTYDKFKRSAAGFGGPGSFEAETYTAPLDLSYEVDLWGRIRRSFEAAGNDAAASEAAMRAVLLAVTADVARHYFQLRQLDAEAQILEAAMKLRADALEVTKRRAGEGLVSDLDVARAQNELATAEADLYDVRRRRTETENALAVLCGEGAPSFKIPPSPLDPAAVPPAVPAGLPSALLERRPDVAEAERRLAAANARIGAAQAAFFPTIRLTGSAGYVSTELDTLFEPVSEVWSFAPSVSVPVFQGGRNVANVNAAGARYDQALSDYKQQILVAFADVENALSSLRWLGEEGRAQNAALEASRKASRISNDRYKQGLASFLDSIDAERQRLQAERASVRVASNRLISTVLLIKALGGAWD